MRRSIFEIALVKKTLGRFRFPLPYLPRLQGYNRWGRATQAKDDMSRQLATPAAKLSAL